MYLVYIQNLKDPTKPHAQIWDGLPHNGEGKVRDEHVLRKIEISISEAERGIEYLKYTYPYS